MSIIRCEKHDCLWDSDFLDDCPGCENEPRAPKPRKLLCDYYEKHVEYEYQDREPK